MSPFGENINAFEAALSGRFGNLPVMAVTSGTAAIHLALAVLGIQAGDTVVVPTFTFAGAVFPIKYLGAEPVFIDCDEETWNMDPELLRQCLSEAAAKGKLPKAVLLVHLYGVPARMREISDICQEYNVPLVEDAADALGASCNGTPLGSFGTMGIISFNGNKIITTSGGGALIFKEGRHEEKARKLANQARENTPYYLHKEVGYNYRLSNISAGIGLGQLPALEERVAARRRNFEHYREVLSEIVPNLSYPVEIQGAFANRWLSVFCLSDSALSDYCVKALRERGIESRPLWKPMHEQPVFANANSYLNGVSSRLFASGICLPSGSSLSGEERLEILEVLRNAIVSVS